jgi:purine-binding chemotaxis protein CheW
MRGKTMDLVKIRKKAKEAGTAKKRGSRGKKSEASKPKKKSVKKQSAKKPPSAPEVEEQSVETQAPEVSEKKIEGTPDVVESPKVPVEVKAEVSTVALEAAVEGELKDLKDVLLSQREEKAEEEEEQVQLLTFMLADEEYGLNIMDIKEIVRPKEATEVPRTPAYIQGIISLRGVIIPIYDVKKRLGLAATDQDPKNRIIVVKSNEHFFGLLVDSVVQVMDVPLSKIEPPPEIVGSVEGEFLIGIGKVDERLIILLNLQKVLAVDGHDTEALKDG